MFSCGQRNKQCSAARLRGFSGNRPFNRPMGHQFILLIPGKLFYLHFPAHRLFLRLESLIPHKPHRPPGLRVLRPTPGIVRFHPFFQVVRPSAVEGPVRTFQKICVVHVVLHFTAIPAPACILPAIPCSLTLYMLCKRQWDHGIHRRPPKAWARGIYMKASGCL